MTSQKIFVCLLTVVVDLLTAYETVDPKKIHLKYIKKISIENFKLIFMKDLSNWSCWSSANVYFSSLLCYRVLFLIFLYSVFFLLLVGTVEFRWRSRQSKRLSPQNVGSIFVMESCEKSQSTLCRKSWVFTRCSVFLPQGKLAWRVRINSVRKVISQLS
jgi:hypothetical protein